MEMVFIELRVQVLEIQCEIFVSREYRLLILQGLMWHILHLILSLIVRWKERPGWGTTAPIGEWLISIVGKTLQLPSRSQQGGRFKNISWTVSMEPICILSLTCCHPYLDVIRPNLPPQTSNSRKWNLTVFWFWLDNFHSSSLSPHNLAVTQVILYSDSNNVEQGFSRL